MFFLQPAQDHARSQIMQSMQEHHARAQIMQEHHTHFAVLTSRRCHLPDSETTAYTINMHLLAWYKQKFSPSYQGAALSICWMHAKMLQSKCSHHRCQRCQRNAVALTGVVQEFSSEMVFFFFPGKIEPSHFPRKYTYLLQQRWRDLLKRQQP